MLGDKQMQHAWMAYADANDVPHDHEDEEAFKSGFDAGRVETAKLRSALEEIIGWEQQLESESAVLKIARKALED